MVIDDCKNRAVGTRATHLFSILVLALCSCTPTTPDPSRKDGAAIPDPAKTVEPTAKEITNSVGMKLNWIPPGRFVRGYKRTEPGLSLMYDVEITHGFFIGVFEVTQDEYELVMGKNPSAFATEGARKDKVVGIDTRRFPVETVSWHDATEFCAKLSEKEIKTYRLPTDAEWEYACRGGARDFTHFHVGDTITAKDANISPENLAEWVKSPKKPVSVGSYAPNGFGLCDMHGNVSEWCHDWYQSDYDSKRSSPIDPVNNKPGDARVIRSGHFGLRPEFCISGFRSRDLPDLRADFLGFRVVLAFPWKEK